MSTLSSLSEAEKQQLNRIMVKMNMGAFQEGGDELLMLRIINRQAEELNIATATLTRMEWVCMKRLDEDNDHEHICLACLATEEEGHDRDCPVHQALSLLCAKSS